MTPILAMLESIVENTPERPVTFIQVARTAGELAFVKEVRAAAAKGQAREGACVRHATRRSRHGRQVPLREARRASGPSRTSERLRPSPDADAYLCGPGGFMADMRAALEAAGVPAKQIHTEAFGTGGEA